MTKANPTRIYSWNSTDDPYVSASEMTSFPKGDNNYEIESSLASIALISGPYDGFLFYVII